MTVPQAEASLELRAAVPLAYALVGERARAAGVRALAIKGPAASLQGLRASRTSVDVDVLVAPTDVEHLAADLARVGWLDGGVYSTPGIVPHHSINLRHPLWPCEIDLHWWFPGFLGEAGAVFDTLWSRRTTVALAGVEVAAPDEVAHAAVLALHHLRDGARSDAQERLHELVDRLGQRWGDIERRELAELAAETGAATTLRPVLQRLGCPSVSDVHALAVDPSAWRLRSEVAGSTQVVPWLVGLARTPWLRRPAFVWRALWLDARHFEVWAGRRLTRREVMVARWRRVRRALRAAPGAREAIRQARDRRRG
jgi:hypothetical protein